MDYLSQYIVPFSGLDNNEHNFDFVVSDEFFTQFDDSTINGGNINVNLKLLKKTDSLQLKISLKGTVNILCDRCLDYYDQEISFSDMVLVEFGAETNFDSNQDCVLLKKGKTEINIAQLIYEFSHFALPLQHYHPNTKTGETGCNKEMLDILNNYLIDEDDEKIDPRWEKLKDIKNKS
ncbi:MAG: DUF177 domain-containing protein [Bacteroidales bacterium]|nr:DUF177 domain-containing protein [Bacteroidales bacterium]